MMKNDYESFISLLQLVADSLNPKMAISVAILFVLIPNLAKIIKEFRKFAKLLYEIDNTFKEREQKNFDKKKKKNENKRTSMKKRKRKRMRKK